MGKGCCRHVCIGEALHWVYCMRRHAAITHLKMRCHVLRYHLSLLNGTGRRCFDPFYIITPSLDLVRTPVVVTKYVSFWDSVLTLTINSEIVGVCPVYSFAQKIYQHCYCPPDFDKFSRTMGGYLAPDLVSYLYTFKNAEVMWVTNILPENAEL